jgi:osomolarity two-component system, response regulator SKN7
MQHQIQALQESYYEVNQTNKILVNEVVSLQKAAKAQSQVANELITHLNHLDERRRSSRHSGSAQSHQSTHSASSFTAGGMGLLPDSTDEPPQELRRARELLSGVASDPVIDRELHRLSVAYHQAGSPPDSASTSSMMYPQAGAPQMNMLHDPMSDMRHLVYPVGQTNGIDPFHADHIQNIPYSRPLSDPNPMAEAQRQATPPHAKDPNQGLWLNRKPNILLVEDDRICARIGQKFLSQVDCVVETAVGAYFPTDDRADADVRSATARRR